MTIATEEVPTRFSDLLARIAEGEQVIVAKDRTPAETIERIKELRRKQPPLSRAELLAMVVGGRKH